jgi:glycerate kinase
MANASGMKLLAREDLNPMKTSSFGTGQLIVKAIKTGAKKIFLGIGGSATVDGGMGMMEAMGVKFYNQNNEILIGSGSNLLHIKSIDTKNLIKFQDIEINIICDVDNPLLGINGAANVFAPQKGASPEMVVKLENGLANFENIIKTYSGIETAGIAGCGAAGGIPIGLVAFMNAVIMEGSEYVLDLLSFDKHVKWADIVITGEGKFDSQSLCNKAPFAVAKRAKKYGKPVYAIVGSNEYPGQTIFKKVLPLSNQNTSLENAIKNAAILVHQRADKLADLLKLI